ncbi:hypothetical protein [Confluentibacter citreus]|uniref:hypothetical protein n=1 Tax=Confluentibacter citreus TaxID=2007307 RepID=UPI0012FDBF05|nr:hypothetical protein [Confluentibacter citreus]
MTTKIHFYLLCLLFMVMSSFTTSLEALTPTSNIQRVRIDFHMPNGYVRHLLFAFTKDNSASDNYDYGFDAINRDNYPYDLNWIINDLRCTTQAVGAFDDSKKYPLGLFMSENGNIEISLNRLENFDAPIDLFIYDALLNTYTKINDVNYAATIPKGDYLNRFYLAFKSENNSFFAKTLGTEDITLKDTKISYLNDSQQLYINTNDKYIVKNIHVYNLNGQKVFTLSQVNSKLIKIPLQISQIKYGIVAIETDQGGLTKKIVLN